MTRELLPEIRHLLVAFISVQKKLYFIYDEKISAIRRSDLNTLNRCLNEENRCNKDFQELIKARKNFLSRAHSFVPGVKTLEEFLTRIGEENNEELLGLVQELKLKTTELRSQSWIHWIIARRSFQHYSQILDLIANCGKTSPTYESPNPLFQSGGAILDASA